jgi:hypothetical protein
VYDNPSQIFTFRVGGFLQQLEQLPKELEHLCALSQQLDFGSIKSTNINLVTVSTTLKK